MIDIAMNQVGKLSLLLVAALCDMRNNFKTFSEASRSYGNTAPLISIRDPT